jgi:ABC-type multidrug transport system fused ATPase/permease subunit
MSFLETVENTSVLGSAWDFLLWFFLLFVFVTYLFVLFSIIGDLFRDHELNGFLKAIWIIFLIFVPFLTAIVYLVARGAGMSRRSLKSATQYRAAQADYIQSVAGVGASPAEEIAKAKELLDAGSISEAEYQAIKAKVLS